MEINDSLHPLKQGLRKHGHQSPPPPPPPGAQILSISCSFREKLAKSYVGGPPPPRGVGAPPPPPGEILDPPLQVHLEGVQDNSYIRLICIE